MGGRGGSSGMGGDSGENINILNTGDIWTFRHNPGNEPFVDAINEGARKIQDDFDDLMTDTLEEIHVATLGGVDRDLVLGFYDREHKLLALNDNFVNTDKMNNVYDEATRQKFHPSRGSLTGTEAVALHELGHALNDHVAKKMGMDFDKAAYEIFAAAYRATKGKGRYQEWAGQISGYAKEKYAETIAESVSDYYCNGNNAHPHSIAIVRELMKYK